MRGFQPTAGRSVQKFADGGLVQRVKRAVGLGDEHNARVAEYRANKATAAAQAPVQPPTASAAPAPATKALSDYSGATAMQRREKELGLADGGRVHPVGFVTGKGTGTSDSIKARLSNKEYVLPADTVEAVGVETLDAIKDATHTPVAQTKNAKDNEEMFFSKGGVVDDEKVQAQSKPRGFFPNNSPDAGVNIYAGVGPANGFGSSGTLATGAEKVIASQPPVQQPTLNQRPAPAPQQPAVQPPTAAAPTPAAPAPQAAAVQQAAPAMLAAPAEDQALSALRRAREAQPPGSANIQALDQSIANRQGSMDGVVHAAGRGLVSAGRGIASLFQKPMEQVAPNPTDMRLEAGTQKAPRGMPRYVPKASEAAIVGGTALNPQPVVQQQAQPVAQPVAQQALPAAMQEAGASPAKPEFDFDNYQPASGQGAFRNEQTGEVTMLQNGPQGGVVQPVPRAAPRIAPRGFDGTQRQEVRAPVLNPNGGVFASMVDFANQKGAAVNAIAANKGMRNDRKDALDASKLDADIATSNARLSLDAQRVGHDKERIGLEGQRVAQGGESNRIAGEELGMRKEVQGFQTRAAKRLEDLQNAHAAENDPTKRSALALQIRELQGKEAPSKWKTHISPNIRNADGSTTEGGVYRSNESTGQVERVDIPKPLLPIDENPAVLKIMSDTKLSRDDRAKQIRAMGYR